MKTDLTILERRIRIASALVVLALAVTLTSLLIFHPLSFVAFVVAGVALLLLANIYFLIAVIRGPGKPGATQLSNT